MESMREEKEQLEQELAAIKSVSSRREADRRAEVREFTTWMSACALLDTPIRLHLKTTPKSRHHIDYRLYCDIILINTECKDSCLPESMHRNGQTGRHA